MLGIILPVIIGVIWIIFLFLYLPKLDEAKDYKEIKRIKNKAKLISILFIFLIIIVAVFPTLIAIVPAGHVGVHDLFGQVEEYERPAGLHFKNPFANIVSMSIKTQEYTMSTTRGEGAKYSSDVIPALTKEGLTVNLDMTVLYRLVPSRAAEIYRTIGINYVDIIVRPQIRTVIREVIARYEAKHIYSADREKIALEIYSVLEPELFKRGVILERVLLRNVQLPVDLVKAIEAKLTAEQEIEKKRFEKEREKEEAFRKIIEAEGIANATSIIQKSLAEAPEYLTWVWLQKLENHNSVVYVMEGQMGLPIFKNIDNPLGE